MSGNNARSWHMRLARLSLAGIFAIETQRSLDMAAVSDNMHGAIQRDLLYTNLIDAGISPERAAEMVEKTMPYADTKSNVRSESLINGKPTSEQARQRTHTAARVASNIPVTLFGVLIFGLWWAVGGKYTIDGLPLLINWAGDLFHFRAGLSAITDWHAYLYLSWIPICMSFVERTSRPDKAIRRSLAWYGILILIAVWLVVSALDFGSTYMAVTTPAPGAWAITKQVATITPLAVAWSSVTTFLPEAALVWVVKLLFKG